MEKDYLTLKRASISHRSGKERDDDYGVLADGVVVGRIFKVRVGGRTPWMCWPRGTTRTAHPHTAMSRRARLRWPPLPRAGDGNRAAAETAYSSMAAAGSSSSTNRAHSWAISIKVARETPPGNIFASCKHARAS